MIKATKLTIVYQVPFEMWSQEKVYAKIEQCVHIESWLNAKYFAMHCWNLNSLQKGLKTALNITVSGNVDFSFAYDDFYNRDGSRKNPIMLAWMIKNGKITTEYIMIAVYVMAEDNAQVVMAVENYANIGTIKYFV